MRKQLKKSKRLKERKTVPVKFEQSEETTVDELAADTFSIEFSERDVASLDSTIRDIRSVVIGLVLVAVFFVGITYWFSTSSFLEEFGKTLAEISGLS